MFEWGANIGTQDLELGAGSDWDNRDERTELEWEQFQMLISNFKWQIEMRIL